MLEGAFDSDLARGIVATDALIGTFADTDDTQLRQNRCFLYHVIGDGTGRWDVPVGGMGALTDALTARRRAGRRRAPRNDAGRSIRADARRGRGGDRGRDAYGAATCWRTWRPRCSPDCWAIRRPAGRAGGLAAEGQPAAHPAPARARQTVSRREAFAGTFHVNEGYEQLRAAYAQAAGGQIPELPPCEAYCHSLTDASILTPAVAQRQAFTP